ncbi:MAG: dethiobiotin synthetase [Actinomycetota bacterium]
MGARRRAQRGRRAAVVTGGLGGVMEAASAGAASAGGLTVGLLPGENRAAANRSVAGAIPTGLGEARNALVVRAADAVVAVGGSWGTLSEVALAMRRGVPVVALGGWSVVDDDGREVPGVRRASTAREAVRLALALAEQVRDIRP